MSIGAFLSPELGLIINSPSICRPCRTAGATPKSHGGQLGCRSCLRARRLEITSVHDVGMEKRRDAGKIVVEDGMPGGTELATRRSICTVFQISTAFDSRLRQLALFMISS